MRAGRIVAASWAAVVAIATLAAAPTGMASSFPMRIFAAIITTITGTGTSPVRSVVYA